MILVAGNCPMGCGEQLVLGENRAVTCVGRGCPRPTAAAEILADPETGHVVEVGEDGWSAKHPLRERLDDELLKCGVSDAVLAWTAPPRPGRYRVRLSERDGAAAWLWEPLD